MWLLLIFVGVPMLEIALFIQVGGLIGLWPTLLIVLVSAIAGTVLMRVQGLQAVARLRRSLQAGGDPVGPIAHGALILVAGVLLLTPGFFTDCLGISLLIPAVRTRVIRWGASRLTVQAATYVQTRRRGPVDGGQTLEGDYEVVDEDAAPRPAGRSGWTRPHS